MPRLRDVLSLFMRWISARHKDHYGQIKGRPYLFGNDQVTVMNGIKGPSQDTNTPCYMMLMAFQRFYSLFRNEIVLC